MALREEDTGRRSPTHVYSRVLVPNSIGRDGHDVICADVQTMRIIAWGIDVKTRRIGLVIKLVLSEIYTFHDNVHTIHVVTDDTRLWVFRAFIHSSPFSSTTLYVFLATNIMRVKGSKSLASAVPHHRNLMSVDL